jgi:hypothetical protein
MKKAARWGTRKGGNLIRVPCGQAITIGHHADATLGVLRFSAQPARSVRQASQCAVDAASGFGVDFGPLGTARIRRERRV